MTRAAGGDVKARIREAAIDLFSRKGYEATSVREIVACAGVTKPTMYYYFGSKEGLARELVLDVVQEFRGALVRAQESQGDLSEAVTTMICDHFRFTRRHLGLVRFLFSTVFGDTGKSFRDEVVAMGKASQAQTKGVVRRAAMQRGLSRRAAGALAEAVTTVMNSEIVQCVAGVGKRLTRKRARAIAGYLVAGAVYGEQAVTQESKAGTGTRSIKKGAGRSGQS